MEEVFFKICRGVVDTSNDKENGKENDKAQYKILKHETQSSVVKMGFTIKTVEDILETYRTSKNSNLNLRY